LQRSNSFMQSGMQQSKVAKSYTFNENPFSNASRIRFFHNCDWKIYEFSQKVVFSLLYNINNQIWKYLQRYENDMISNEKVKHR
jgi:hypothetical protein